MPSSMLAQFAALAVIAPVAVLAQSAIKPGASDRFCVQPQHGSMADGTPFVLGGCNNTPEQAAFLENGVVRYFNNMCLVAGAGDGDLVTIAQCDPANQAQQWIYDTASRTFQSQTGSCLDLSNGAVGVGAAIGTWPCTAGNPNQVWDVAGGNQPAPQEPAPGEPAPEEPIPEEPTPEVPAPEEPTPEEPAPEEPAPEEPAPGEPTPEVPAPEEPAPEEPAPADPVPEEPTAPPTEPTETTTPPAEPTDAPAPPVEGGVSIKPKKKDNLCLAAAENKDGAAVVLAECNGDASQLWVNEKKDKVGIYRIFGDKCMDVQEGRNEKGTKIQIWTCVNGGSNQLFEPKGEHLSWYFFDKCLDVTNGVYRVGQQAQIWQCSHSPNQNWIIA